MLIDTHRHLGGCVPIWWVWETIKTNKWFYIAECVEEVEQVMTFTPNEPLGFHRFLDKFTILDKIHWNEELIDSSIAAVCLEMEKEGLDYCWLDFSINKYMEPLNWHKRDAIQFIYSSFQRHRPNKVGLVLSLKYESMRASQRQYAKLIDDPKVVDCLFGLDLVGNEEYFDYEFYRPIFEEWNNAGKMTRAHVSESQGAVNGLQAMQYLKVSNIAHGLKMMEHQDIIEISKDLGITFDLGISSNYLTDVCGTEQHPIIKMLDNDLKVTLGTDDPIQCNTTLKQEFEKARSIGITDEQCRKMQMIAVGNTMQYTL